MRRGVIAICCAAPAMGALLTGCGGGHGVQASGGSAHARPQSSATQPPASAPQPTASAPTASTPVAVPPVGAYWPYEKLVTQLTGHTLALPRGPVRLDGALIECNGEGASLKTGATRRWGRYICTQTLFQGGADRDVTFDVTIVSPTRLSITSPRYGPT